MQPERVFEMLWDCSYCGAAKLLGKSQQFCPQCGAPQDPKTRYFPAEEDKVEATGYRYEGADKICPACQSPNGALAEFCGRCGSSLSGAKEASRLTDQVRSDEAKFAASLSLRKQEEAQRRNVVPALDNKAAGKRGPGLWIILAVVALAAFVLTILFWTKDETATVTAHHWRQEIQIERYGPVPESAWCDQMPFGAYGVSQHQEVRSHRQVPDGQDCQMRRIDRGDGTFAEREECQTRYRSEPVYDQRCEYRIDRWSPSRSVVAEGQDLNPRWPATGLTAPRQCVGCEREGPRATDYVVVLQGTGGKEYRCSLPLERWRGMLDASHWNLKVGAVDKRPRCDSLKPAG